MSFSRLVASAGCRAAQPLETVKVLSVIIQPKSSVRAVKVASLLRSKGVPLYCTCALAELVAALVAALVAELAVLVAVSVAALVAALAVVLAVLLADKAAKHDLPRHGLMSR